MAALVGLPTLDLNIARPRLPRVDIVGAGLEGGRNGLGEAHAIEFSGGGAIVLSYECAPIRRPEHHAYFVDLAGRLNGSHRNINVPILADWISGGVRIGGQLFAPNGALGNGSGDFLTAVTAETVGNAAIGAGRLRFRIRNARPLLGRPRWFSINHPTKGHRAYRTWETISQTNEAEPVFEAAITPALREAVPAGTALEVTQPKFAARFPVGFTLAWEPGLDWLWEPTLQFVEAF